MGEKILVIGGGPLSFYSMLGDYVEILPIKIFNEPKVLSLKVTYSFNFLRGQTNRSKRRGSKRTLKTYNNRSKQRKISTGIPKKFI